MTPRIAIPQPTSRDHAYNARNWPAYADAVRQQGAEPILFDLELSPRAVAELANTCHAILLPGSPADVNPGKYGQEPDPAAAPADLPRESVDELLLQDGHNLYKPILGICFGCQILNVWRSGTLLQALTVMPVNHAAAPSVGVAHTVVLEPRSILAQISAEISKDAGGDGLIRVPVNSSHHQAVGIAGDGLRVVARCPQDGVVEAIEGAQHPTAPHFVLGVQWHPERTTSAYAISRGIFSAFVAQASAFQPRLVTTSVVR